MGTVLRVSINRPRRPGTNRSTGLVEGMGQRPGEPRVRVRGAEPGYAGAVAARRTVFSKGKHRPAIKCGSGGGVSGAQ